MFDAKRFLADNFRDPDGLVGAFHAYRLDIPPKDTVRKWFSRATIPSEWFVMIIVVLELENGRPVSLTPYIGDQRG